jgi:hypothetical protein
MDEYSSDVNEEVLTGVPRAVPIPSVAGTIKPANPPNKYDTPDSLRKLGLGRGARRRGMEFHQTDARPGTQERQDLPRVSARQIIWIVIAESISLLCVNNTSTKTEFGKQA